MLGVATLNVGHASGELVIWLTSPVGDYRARHTNAVVIERDDPESASKVWSLTADRYVVALVSSDVAGLDAHPIGFNSAMDLLRGEVATRRAAIEDAIHAHARRTRSNLVVPRWTRPPAGAPDEQREHVSMTVAQTLAAASSIANIWNAWLETENHRRQRIESPKGQRPWIMPGGLDDPSVEVLPAEFVAVARDAFVKVAPHV